MIYHGGRGDRNISIPAGRREAREEGRPGEASVPAKPAAQAQDAWLSGANAHGGRAERPSPAAAAGQTALGSIIGGSSSSGMSEARGQHAGRLRGRSEFSRVYRQGHRHPGNTLVLYFRPTGTSRKIGVTAGRGLGGAVARNRAKRRLREALRTLEARLIRRGEIVLVARPLAGTARFSEIVEEMEALCRVGQLLNEDNR